jgi:hypothetical protein
MACDVCIGVDSIDEPFEFSTVEIRKARKPHACFECHQQIKLGDSYEHTTGKFDGRFATYRTCLLCREIRDVFTCGNSWYYGELWEEMREGAFENLTTASPCFNELSLAAKAFVLEQWRRWKGLSK